MKSAWASMMSVVWLSFVLVSCSYYQYGVEV